MSASRQRKVEIKKHSIELRKDAYRDALWAFDQLLASFTATNRAEFDAEAQGIDFDPDPYVEILFEFLKRYKQERFTVELVGDQAIAERLTALGDDFENTIMGLDASADEPIPDGGKPRQWRDEVSKIKQLMYDDLIVK